MCTYMYIYGFLGKIFKNKIGVTLTIQLGDPFIYLIEGNFVLVMAVELPDCTGHVTPYSR